ncbi:MAG: cobalamin biosynthesis protein, partial [Firmicutes bacterium]|nr:cobalamin biosynthesis protein [Bacillota bacterium]
KDIEGYGEGESLKERSIGAKEWTGKAFEECDGIIFIGAVGIAVRMIAPYIRGKDIDPAVVVCDEKGKYVIPILSGHIGGANRLAERIAEMIGAECIITTATDINDVFAVDSWAYERGYVIEDIGKIKYISSALIKGEKVGLKSFFEVQGNLPENVVYGENFENGIVISPFAEDIFKNTVSVVPKCVVLGVGSRKNADKDSLIKLFEKTGISKNAVNCVSTIDIKENEAAVLELCKYLGVGISVYSAEELENVKGDFSSSEFVKKVTGIDNVCERACVRESGGEMIMRKTVGDGVTMAASVKKEVIGF